MYPPSLEVSSVTDAKTAFTRASSMNQTRVSVRTDNGDDFCGQRLLSVSMNRSYPSGNVVVYPLRCSVATIHFVNDHCFGFTKAYPFHFRNESIFDRLDVEAGVVIPKTMRFYPYRMTFDIECM